MVISLILSREVHLLMLSNVLPLFTLEETLCFQLMPFRICTVHYLKLKHYNGGNLQYIVIIGVTYSLYQDSQAYFCKQFTCRTETTLRSWQTFQLLMEITCDTSKAEHTCTTTGSSLGFIFL